jgi:hypothetical protein
MIAGTMQSGGVVASGEVEFGLERKESDLKFPMEGGN